MKVSRVPSSKCNPDLVKERANCPFDVEELADFLAGGREIRREIRSRVAFSESLLDPDEAPLDSLSAEERYERQLKMLHKVVMESKKPDSSTYFRAYIPGSDHVSTILFPEASAFALHHGMFMPTITGQGNSLQQKQWGRRAKNFNIIGTYAQTELGHGTFLRGLETTATYDPKTKEFILNSPKLTSLKWWPGGLGTTANHAVVMAQLITQGKSMGPHSFVVPLRDPDTHKPYPGIKVRITINDYHELF